MTTFIIEQGNVDLNIDTDYKQRRFQHLFLVVVASQVIVFWRNTHRSKLPTTTYS